MKKIRQLNKQYQNIILSEIKRVEEQNGKIQELSNTCQRLFDQFSEKQSQCIEMLSFKSLQDCFYDNLGLELTTPLQTKIGIVSSVISGGVIVGDVSIAGYCAASTLITPVGVAATGVLGAGLLLIAIKKMIVENKFNSVQDVESKLNLLENVLNQRIAEVCQNFISNNNQTIQCLKELFKVFAEGHLDKSQQNGSITQNQQKLCSQFINNCDFASQNFSQSDSNHRDPACLQYDQTLDAKFSQVSLKEQQQQYQGQSMYLSLQYWDEIQAEFFSDINNKLQCIGRNLQIWKKLNLTKLEKVDDIIAQEENEYNKLSAQVKDIKIYIVVQGTISAGKSTFLNALLGGQILPIKNQECTKQILEITYNDKIKINGENFELIDEARGKLQEIQQNELIQVKVEFPSLFHLDFPEDLRSRIILVDTYILLMNHRPGIKFTNKQFISNFFEKLDEMIGNNPVINVWISKYMTFRQDQEKIFCFLKNGKIKEKNIQNKLEFIYQKKQCQEFEKEQCKDKLLFLLNKYDERDEENDEPIQFIIDDICQQIGDNNCIFKISAKQAEQYRIMTLGNQMSQNFFVKQYFLKFKNEEQFQNLKQCQKHCENKFQGKTRPIADQEFPILMEQIQKQIKFKINSELNGQMLDKIMPIDYYLRIFLNLDFREQIKLKYKLKALVVDFIHNIYIFLNDYEIKLEKIKNIYLLENLYLIDNAKQSLTELNFLDIFRGNKSILQKLCEEILEKEVSMGQEIRDLNNQIQQKILKEIQKIEKQQINLELSNICQNLFKQFYDSQNLCIEISQFQTLNENFKDNLGFQFDFQTKVTKANSLWVPNVSIQTLAVCSCFLPVGLAAVFLGGGLLLKQKSNIKEKFLVNDFKEKLNSLKGLQISRIDGICERFISNNNQTISCLKNLFNRLIQ